MVNGFLVLLYTKIFLILTWAVIIEPVSEAGGVPVSPHHDDLVLRGVELGSRVEAYQVETLGYGLAWLPELDNQDQGWLIIWNQTGNRQVFCFPQVSDLATDLLSELWRTEDLSSSQKAQRPKSSHDEAACSANIFITSLLF